MEAARSRQVAEFLKDMLNGVTPSVALGRDTTMLREILDNTAERIGEDLDVWPEVEADLRATIAWVYENLGDYAKSELMQWEVLRIRRELFGNEHLQVADSLYRLGWLHFYRNSIREAKPLFQESLTIRRNVLGHGHADVARSLYGLAWTSDISSEESLNLFRESLAIRMKLFGEQDLDVAQSLRGIARALLARGSLAEAETAQRKALSIQESLRDDGHPELLKDFYNLGLILQQRGKLAEAEGYYRASFAKRSTVLGRNHPDTVKTTAALGAVHAELGELDLARALFSQLSELSPTNGASFYECALLSLSVGDTDGYRDTVERIVNHLQTSAPGPGLHLLTWACALGPDALTNYSPVIEAMESSIAAETNSGIAVAYAATLGALRYRACEYPEAARQLAETHLQAGQLNSEQIPTSSGYRLYFLAMTHARLGQTNEAIRWFQRASESDPMITPPETNAAAGNPWNRRLTLQLLRQEAESVLKALSPEPESSR